MKRGRRLTKPSSWKDGIYRRLDRLDRSIDKRLATCAKYGHVFDPKRSNSWCLRGCGSQDPAWWLAERGLK